MFFNLIKRNAQRSRKENIIYFATLVTAVASFYLILSLERQDVILYLKDFESQAIERLFSLMPILYFFALFLLFFLVLFANRYQLERRSKEFGMYLMLGMRQQRLFLLLVAESVLTSLFALVIGIGMGAIVAEILSLTTARLIGQGIIGHQISFSIEAVMTTAAGFLFIQIIALMILAVHLFRRELHTLLYGQVEKKQKIGERKNNLLTFLIGLILLLVAYWLIITYFWIVNVPMIFLAVVFGLIGTILVIRGIARIINAVALQSKQTNGLATFTLRQLQENIANRSIAVATASILMMLSVIMLAEGAAMILSSTDQLQQSNSVYDFTVQGEASEVEAFLESEKMAPYVANVNPLELGRLLRGEETAETILNWEKLRERIVENLPEGKQDPAIEFPGQMSISPEQSEAENLLGMFDERMGDYLIRESSYNLLLEAAGEEPLQLAENQVGIYINSEFVQAEQPLLNQILTDAQMNQEVLAELDGQPLTFIADIPMKGLVTDRSITVMTGLIVPDELFETYTDSLNREVYWNFTIPEDLEEEQGLMIPMKEASDILDESGFQFESYLQNFGRYLFYIVAGSYTMLYLAFLFLIIGCTVLALQFLTQLKQTKRRYQTLSFLGAKRDQMQASLKKQVMWYFLFPLIPALVSGTVGIIAMKSYIRFNAEFLPSIARMMPYVLLMVGVFLLVQWIYARAVYKTGIQEIEQQQFK